MWGYNDIWHTERVIQALYKRKKEHTCPYFFVSGVNVDISKFATVMSSASEVSTKCFLNLHKQKNFYLHVCTPEQNGIIMPGVTT